MKNFLVLSLFVFSSVLVAAPAERAIPKSIVCVSKALSSAVKKFKVTALDTKEPESTITDSGLLDFQIFNNDLMKLSFSNECDNYYGITFFMDDLMDLNAKRVTKITGLMNYGDVELSELKETEEQTSETVTVTCRLK